MIIQRFDFTAEVTIVIDSEETGIDGHCGVQPSPKWAIVDYWTWATVQTLVKNLPMSCPYTRLNTTINIISISVNPYTAIYICRYSIPGLKILIGQTTALQDAARSPPHLGPTCSDASDRDLYWYRHVFLFFYFYFIRQLTSASASDVFVVLIQPTATIPLDYCICLILQSTALLSIWYSCTVHLH